MLTLWLKKFDNIADEYLKDRSQDVKDICRRILSNLIGFDVNATNCEGRILIAKELSAGDVLKYSSEKVKGIILLSGGVTSHVCILASSLQLPVIIADEPRLMSIRNNTRVLMDAEIGNLYINPTDDIIESQEGRKIRDIFERDGWQYFRRIERQVVRRLAKLDNKIIENKR